MNLKIIINRIKRYYLKHGMANTIVKAFQNIKRAIFEKTVLVYVDLPYLDIDKENIQLPEGISMDKILHMEEIQPEDMKVLIKCRGTAKIKRELQRLKEGAVLWLIKFGDELAGFIWTIKGKYIAPYYIPFMKNDAAVFDAEIFPEFRGGKFEPLCENNLLLKLKEEGIIRVYVSMKNWNYPVLRSRKVTPYLLFGITKKIHVFNRDITIWYDLSKHDIAPHELALWGKIKKI